MNKYIFAINRFDDYKSTVLPDHPIHEEKLWDYIYTFFCNRPDEKYLKHFVKLVVENVDEKQNLVYNLEIYSVNK
ncbi:MAG: hypothetical protein AABY22_20330 [Nanoarchaeota archaeon]